jgi:predicted secreted protein
MPQKTSLLVLLATAFVAAASAQDASVYDRVDLSASAGREVPNDLVIAIVYAEVENNDQARAANEVNEAIRWAADQARSVSGVSLETQQYTTRPVYANDRRIVGWVARQSLRLESSDAQALGRLIGDLQSRVAIQSLGSGLSPAAREAAEESLIAEALSQFRRRAALIADELGREGYRLVHINVGSAGGFYPVQFDRPEMARTLSVAAPEIEAGNQTVTVSVNGTIELDTDR